MLTTTTGAISSLRHSNATRVMTQINYAEGPKACQHYESTVNPIGIKYFCDSSFSITPAAAFQFDYSPTIRRPPEKSGSCIDTPVGRGHKYLVFIFGVVVANYESYA